MILPDGHLLIAKVVSRRRRRLEGRRLKSRSVGFLYTVLRRRPSQLSPTSAVPAAIHPSWRCQLRLSSRH